ncbi:hypothetical protein [Paenibacillus aceti]|nr:hypothetical protein [Paenibacillus aceti]
MTKSKAVKIFFLGWQASKISSDIDSIITYFIQNDLSNYKNTDYQWWMLLLERLEVQKDWLSNNIKDRSNSVAIKNFIVRDLSNPKSLLNSLYICKEFSSGTINIEVYNELHSAIEYLKNVSEEELDLNFIKILQNIKKYLNAVIGIISRDVPYMHIENVIQLNECFA